MKQQKRISPVQAPQTQGTLSGIFRQKRNLWLAGMLTFFIPSVAAAAWYAGGNSSSVEPESSVAASAPDAQASSANAQSTSSSDSGASASSSQNNVSASTNGSSVQAVMQPSGATQVYINGKPVSVPTSGNVNQTTVNSDGSTSHVSVSVNANQNGTTSNSNGYSSTNTFVNSNSSSFTNGGTTTTVTNNNSSP